MIGELKRSAARDAASPGPSGGDPRLEVGVLGDFRIIREVGRGGMGVVYEARQLSLDRRVALKVLPLAAAMDGKQLQRFELEAHAAACLHHTNIVPVHVVGCERGVPFYAMQFIEGRSLAQLIAELRRLEGLDGVDTPAAHLADISTSTLAAGLLSGRPSQAVRPAVPAEPGPDWPRPTSSPPAPAGSASPTTPAPGHDGGSSPGSSTRSRAYIRTVAQLGVQVAEALDHAHTRGILHRDIKPANLLLDEKGQLWVTDFGLAQIQGNAGLTLTGDILGTLRYMSPEQALARRVVIDGRTDIYSLGVTLYELLTLRPAIDGPDRGEILRRIAEKEPSPPRSLNPAVPRDLETICLKCLHKDPRRRYATAAALADDLNRFLRDQPIAARPVGRLERVLRWMRRNPTATALIVTAALLLGLAGAAGLREWGLVMQWSERLARVIELQEHGRFDEARGVLYQPPVSTAHLRKRIEQARANLDLVEGLEAIRLSRGYGVQGDNIDYAESSRRYVVAFLEWGLGDLWEDPDRVAARLNASPIREALVAALDDWAACANKEVRDWVLRVARRMDPDPWRDRVRDPDGWERMERFPELADMARVEEQPVTLMVAFGTRWRRLGGDPTAFLERVRRQHPNDFWVNFELGHLFGERDPAVAIGYFRAAEVLRPDAAVVQTKLGYELSKLGELHNAIHHWVRAVRIDPDHAVAWYDLGSALLEVGRVQDAADSFRQAKDRFEKKAAENPRVPSVLRELADFLTTCPAPQFRDPHRAVMLAKQALQSAPLGSESWKTLGLAAYQAGQWDDAIEAWGKWLALGNRRDPWAGFRLAIAHGKLGHKQDARKWYDQAVGWMDPQRSRNEELRRLRAEAAALLGLHDPAAPAREEVPCL
jgi:serine/threonine protein kinase/Flp pilus assembly protein TadD